MADPPLDAGGVNVIVSCPLPAVAVPIVGAPGTVAATVIEKACVAEPPELLAVTMPVKVPAAAGVPLSTPVVPFSVTPAGKDPDVSPKVGAGEPVAV